jgi:hypothetical protein
MEEIKAIRAKDRTAKMVVFTQWTPFFRRVRERGEMENRGEAEGEERERGSIEAETETQEAGSERMWRERKRNEF